jgi:L-malate glycosyltransferase
MFKVLHIIGSAHFGGIEKLVYDLSKAQHKKHVDVGILILKQEGEFLDRFLKTGIPCYFSNIKSGFDFSFGKYRKIYKILKEYDIVNVHSFNPILSFFLWLSKTKIVYTVHSVRGFGRVKKRFESLKLTFQKVFFNRIVDFITFNSNYSRSYWSDILSNTPNKVIYNGIDFSSENYHPNETINLDIESNFIIGTSCRFIKWKRVDKLINAFKKFQEKISDAKLLLVGDGPERSSLEKLAQDLGIEEHVIFTGFRDDVRAYQNSMDVCVFPSTTETFGLVAIETLLLGKPTIVFEDGGGITEIINGISKEDVVADENELMQRLIYYFDNNVAITQGVEKRINYAKEFNIENMAEEFNVVYSQLM